MAKASKARAPRRSPKSVSIGIDVHSDRLTVRVGPDELTFCEIEDCLAFAQNWMVHAQSDMKASGDQNVISVFMDRWPSVPEFARDIGIKATHAHVLRVRNSIPVEYWPAIVKAAAIRGFDCVTADSLLALHAEAKKPS